MPRRYTKAVKNAAVGQALATTPEQAAESLGIPRSTIRYWVEHQDFAELRQTTRDQMADRMWATIQTGLAEVDRGLRDPEVPLRDKVVAVGVIYDKHALLTGAATSRSESRDLTGSLSDTDLIVALREAERLAAREGASEPPAVEAGPTGLSALPD